MSVACLKHVICILLEHQMQKYAMNVRLVAFIDHLYDDWLFGIRSSGTDILFQSYIFDFSGSLKDYLTLAWIITWHARFLYRVQLPHSHYHYLINSSLLSWIFWSGRLEMAHSLRLWLLTVTHIWLDSILVKSICKNWITLSCQSN